MTSKFLFEISRENGVGLFTWVVVVVTEDTVVVVDVVAAVVVVVDEVAAVVVVGVVKVKAKIMLNC